MEPRPVFHIARTGSGVQAAEDETRPVGATHAAQKYIASSKREGRATPRCPAASFISDMLAAAHRQIGHITSLLAQRSGWLYCGRITRWNVSCQRGHAEKRQRDDAERQRVRGFDSE